MFDYGTNFRAQKADVHQFAMIPRSDIPRSKFRMQHQHKTTILASSAVPVYVQEILPGDSFNVRMTCFTRMATPVFPIMDNMDIESFFFFVPCRLVWSHWVNFMGEQPSTPSDSISYSIPQIVSPASGFVAGSLYDYMGIPGSGQIGGGNTISVNALPFRAYNLIFNQWFRNENTDNAKGTGATNTVGDIGDGPDPYTNYSFPFTVRKRHDYFTSALPWTQKGGVVSTPLAGKATVFTNATDLVSGAQSPLHALDVTGATMTAGQPLSVLTGGTNIGVFATPPAQSGAQTGAYPSNLYADLSTATATTINALRLAFQTQRLLERDARAGTRYTEIIRSHFGVVSPDMRLQRPEYLGGGKTPVNIVPVPQTTATGLTGGSSPLGTLAAVGTSVAHNHGFRQSFTEHGYVIGIVCVRADPVYQQGMRRMWTRSTRYDFYLPVFQALGEQAIRNDEIYCDGSANDTAAFGYQERWAEYRYFPSMVTGAFRSTFATPLDAWHLAQKFTSLPALNTTFMTDVTVNTLDRILAAGSTARTNNEQFLCDFFFDVTAARPMPMYSVPGMIDHF